MIRIICWLEKEFPRSSSCPPGPSIGTRQGRLLGNHPGAERAGHNQAGDVADEQTSRHARRPRGFFPNGGEDEFDLCDYTDVSSMSTDEEYTLLAALASRGLNDTNFSEELGELQIQGRKTCAACCRAA
ncbi:unnamed protein product [Prorocentrum cordatum]|uniref:Uncharacterized protein n=1 Tax=Prorocentrum cordatum TaxID=2364126 RepID=A0ABN9Q2P0_9DINO|nr:unnamed protein product [Polarella glacialis]